MVTTVEELEAQVHASLELEKDRHVRALDDLLAEYAQIRGWEALAGSSALRDVLAARRGEVAGSLAELLTTWRRAGGTLALSLPRSPPTLFLPSSLPAILPPSPPAPVADVAVPPAENPPAAVPAQKRDTPRPPPSPAATTVALAGLKDHIEGGGAFPTPPTPVIDEDWQRTLARCLLELVPAREAEGDLNNTLSVISRAESWTGLPAEVQRSLAGALAARLRSLQEHSFPDDRRVAHGFGILSAFMKRERPGFVSGLSRTHRPRRGTWEADADAFLERLNDLLPAPPQDSPNFQKKLAAIEVLVKELDVAPEELRDAVVAQMRRETAALLAAGLAARNPRLVRIVAPAAAHLDAPEFRVLRRAIRDDQDAGEEDDESEARTGALPADWPWWPRTRGRRAVMIGGSPRELNRARLQEAFGFGELDWLPAEFRRNSLQVVRDRVKADGVDLVILLRSFVGHDADQVILPACREHEVGWVSVEQGYGVVRVKQAIERFLDLE